MLNSLRSHLWSRVLVGVVALLGRVVAATSADPAVQEFHVRGGLPNVQARLAADQEVRVAFLGGSITAADGWRVFTLDGLRARFPRARFTEIYAAVSGTGSEYGAPRLQRDVLRHRPDLLLVEFAVNDGRGSPEVEAQMEGIVRQTWAADPHTDVCFVYTASAATIEPLRHGRLQSAVESMERVASHYAIPSVNFGVEIARRLAANTLVMFAPAAVAADAAGCDPQGRLIFTRDQTHPLEPGHRIYAARLGAALATFFAAGARGPHALPAPQSAEAWQLGRLVTLQEFTRPNDWDELAPESPQMKAGQGSRGLVPLTWFARRAGATLEFSFRGTVLGIIGLKGPDNGQFQVTVDDEPPKTATLFDSFSTPGRYLLKPWFYSKHLRDDVHHVRLTLLETRIDKAAVMARAGKPITDPAPYAANGLYLSGFLIVGEVVR